MIVNEDYPSIAMSEKFFYSYSHPPPTSQLLPPKHCTILHRSFQHISTNFYNRGGSGRGRGRIGFMDGEVWVATTVMKYPTTTTFEVSPIGFEPRAYPNFTRQRNPCHLIQISIHRRFPHLFFHSTSISMSLIFLQRVLGSCILAAPTAASLQKLIIKHQVKKSSCGLFLGQILDMDGLADRRIKCNILADMDYW